MSIHVYAINVETDIYSENQNTKEQHIQARSLTGGNVYVDKS